MPCSDLNIQPALFLIDSDRTKPDQQPTRIQQLRLAGFMRRIRQPWLQQPTKPESTTKTFNNQGFSNQQSRIQQPKKIQQPKQPDSATMASATKKAGFNNQGFNNQQSIQQPKPRIQQPQSSTTKGSTTKRVVGWGGWGVDSITVSILLVMETMVLESVPTMVVESGVLVVES